MRHLEEATDFVAMDKPVAAARMRRRILDAVAGLGKLPFSGRPGRIAGTREAVVPRTPYIVVYEVSSTAVEVLGIWHGSVLWPESRAPWNS